MDGREKTLLRRCTFCGAELDESEPGAKLCRPALAPWNILLETDRRTEERPASAPKGPPMDARGEIGLLGPACRVQQGMAGVLRRKWRVVKADRARAFHCRRRLRDRRVVLDAPQSLHSTVSSCISLRQPRRQSYLAGALDTEQSSILRHDDGQAAIVAGRVLSGQTISRRYRIPSVEGPSGMRRASPSKRRG